MACACGSSGQHLTQPALSKTRPPGHSRTAYRFAVRPVVMFEIEQPASNSLIRVVARLNRKLPPGDHGVSAALLVNGNADIIRRPVAVTHERPCYAAEWENVDAANGGKPSPGFAHPRDGQV